MIRRITFNEDGDIVIDTTMHHDVCKFGVVLLTEEQAQEAERHGWRRFGNPVTETRPHLIPVQRDRHCDQCWCEPKQFAECSRATCPKRRTQP